MRQKNVNAFLQQYYQAQNKKQEHSSFQQTFSNSNLSSKASAISKPKSYQNINKYCTNETIFFKIKYSINPKISYNKFRLNTLKNKSLLYEDQHVQIGFKKQLVYDFITSKYCLRFFIFYGNKTENLLNISTCFYSNDDLKVYKLQQTSNLNIQGNSQLKQTYIMDLNSNFQIYPIKISININNNQITNIFLPILAHNFLKFRKTNKKELQDQTNIQQTDWFRLNVHIIKKDSDTIIKYLPQQCFKINQQKFIVQFQYNLQYGYIIFEKNRQNMKITMQGKFKDMQKLINEFKFSLMAQ